MRTANKNNLFALRTAFFDLMAIMVSYLGTYLFRFMSGWVPMRGDMPSVVAYAQTMIIIVPVYIWFFRAYGLYDSHRRIRRIEEIFQVVKAVTFAIVILTAMSFFYRGLSYSRIYLLIFWIFSILTVSFTRYFLIQWEYKRKKERKEISRVLLVGTNRNARQIIQWARHNPHYGQEIVGALSKDPNIVEKHVEGVPVLGTSDRCEIYINELKPDIVVLADPTIPRDRITELVVACEDQWIELKVVADVYGLMTRHVDVEYVSTVPLLGFKALPLDDPWKRFVKRTFDIVVSLALQIPGSKYNAFSSLCQFAA